jgi:hypothetical protein
LKWTLSTIGKNRFVERRHIHVDSFFAATTTWLPGRTTATGQRLLFTRSICDIFFVLTALGLSGPFLASKIRSLRNGGTGPRQ